MTETQGSTQTPGPWHVPATVRLGNGLDLIPKHVCCGSGSNVGIIAEVPYPDTPEGQAHLRLMAASPELLEALRRITLESNEGVPNRMKLAEINSIARAAVKKAAS